MKTSRTRNASASSAISASVVERSAGRNALRNAACSLREEIANRAPCIDPGLAGDRVGFGQREIVGIVGGGARTQPIERRNHFTDTVGAETSQPPVRARDYVAILRGRRAECPDDRKTPLAARDIGPVRLSGDIGRSPRSQNIVANLKGAAIHAA